MAKKYTFYIGVSMECVQIKALTVLVGRMSLSVGCENYPEQGLVTVSFYP